MVVVGCLRKPVIFLLHGMGKARPSRSFPLFSSPSLQGFQNVLPWAGMRTSQHVSRMVLLLLPQLCFMRAGKSQRASQLTTVDPRSKKQPRLPLSSVFSLAWLPGAESSFIDYDILWEVFAYDLSLCWFLPSLSLFFTYCTISIHMIRWLPDFLTAWAIQFSILWYYFNSLRFFFMAL